MKIPNFKNTFKAQEFGRLCSGNVYIEKELMHTRRKKILQSQKILNKENFSKKECWKASQLIAQAQFCREAAEAVSCGAFYPHSWKQVATGRECIICAKIEKEVL